MKKKNDSIFLHQDTELESSLVEQNESLLKSSTEAQAIAAELEDLRALMREAPVVEDSERFVRQTLARLEQPSFVSRVFAKLQPMQSSLEWSFASALLFLGLIVTPDSALLEENTEIENSPYIDVVQDQEFLQALDNDVTSIQNDELFFQLGEDV